jgi:hypothetical protein
LTSADGAAVEREVFTTNARAGRSQTTTERCPSTRWAWFMGSGAGSARGNNRISQNPLCALSSVRGAVSSNDTRRGKVEARRAGSQESIGINFRVPREQVAGKNMTVSILVHRSAGEKSRQYQVSVATVRTERQAQTVKVKRLRDMRTKARQTQTEHQREWCASTS